MTGIEFTVVVLSVFVGIMFIILWIISSEIKKVETESTKTLYEAKKDINKNIELLAKYIGMYTLKELHSDGDSSLHLHHEYETSPNDRINLLMDHLNLEIKEGEPSKTILVKKKPIKKGK